MRVAVVYAGELRTWEYCRQKQLDSFKADIVDLYFYTYDQPLNTNYTRYEKAELWGGKWDDRYDSNKHPWLDTARGLKTWENLYNCFLMIPNEYDVIVKSRTDIILSNSIDFSDYNYDNTVHIPIGNDYEGGVNDQFAFGNFNSMKKYFDIYLNHPILFNMGLRYHTEFYILKNLEIQNVLINRTSFTNQIIR